MSKKTLFGVDYTDKEWIKIILYLFVGGTAALVEWAFFYGFNQGIGMEYMLATAAAFCLATLYHYFLGNILVFTSGARYEKGKELSLVFAVSIMGLAFNLILMYIFCRNDVIAADVCQSIGQLHCSHLELSSP